MGIRRPIDHCTVSGRAGGSSVATEVVRPVVDDWLGHVEPTAVAAVDGHLRRSVVGRTGAV